MGLVLIFSYRVIPVLGYSCCCGVHSGTHSHVTTCNEWTWSWDERAEGAMFLSFINPVSDKVANYISPTYNKTCWRLAISFRFLFSPCCHYQIWKYFSSRIESNWKRDNY
jgi:hypothetical protein